MSRATGLRIVAAAAIMAFMFVVGIQFRTAAATESNTLKWKSFNEGMAEAKQTNKKVLIDVYTNWCSWCKKMDAQTYADKNVSNYLNTRYVVIKLNAESDKKISYKNQAYTERELAAAFGINGYPSTIFLKADAEPITVFPGFADAKKFRQVISFIAENHYLSKKFEDYILGK